MQVTIELPDDLADQIQKASGDVARRVLEAFANRQLPLRQALGLAGALVTGTGNAL